MAAVEVPPRRILWVQNDTFAGMWASSWCTHVVQIQRVFTFEYRVSAGFFRWEHADAAGMGSSRILARAQAKSWSRTGFYL